MATQPTPTPSPHLHDAQQAEGFLLMQQENAYLKQRCVALNVRIRELTEEVESLKPKEEAPDAEEGR